MNEDLEEEVATISENQDSSILVIDDDGRNSEGSRKASKKDFVDLTKGYGPLLVDLTNDDSPVVLHSSGGSRARGRRTLNLEEQDDCPDVNNSASNASSPSSSPAKKIVCPVCMEDSKQIFRRHKRLVSTICGHVFCEDCLKEALKFQKKCPTCRKTLRSKQFHPLYI